MTKLPDFAGLDFDAITVAPAAEPAPRAPWLTPEGVAVKAAYGPEDTAGLDFPAFTAALAHAALAALSKPAFTHLYPTPRDKVLVLLEMWGLADERKLSEIARMGRR